jgi:hypothetical protein
MLSSIAKSAVLTDMGAVESLLRERSSTGLDAFISSARNFVPASPSKRGKAAGAAVHNDLVERYRRQLEANLGNEAAFLPVYNQLRDDALMAPGEMAALTRLMAGSAARGKPAGLRKIFSLHQALMTFKAKDRATGGRSAA